MLCMELAQTKIPYLPPEWTVARVAKYAAKLGVFILVPRPAPDRLQAADIGGVAVGSVFCCRVFLRE